MYSEFFYMAEWSSTQVYDHSVLLTLLMFGSVVAKDKLIKTLLLLCDSAFPSCLHSITTNKLKVPSLLFSIASLLPN